MQHRRRQPRRDRGRPAFHRPSRSVSVAAVTDPPVTKNPSGFHRPSRSVSVAARSPPAPAGRLADVSPAVPVGLRCSLRTDAELPFGHRVSPAVPVGLRCSVVEQHELLAQRQPFHRPSRSVSVAASPLSSAGLMTAGLFHRPSRSVSVAARRSRRAVSGIASVSPAVPVGLRCSIARRMASPSAITVSPAVPVGLRCSSADALISSGVSPLVSPAVPVGLRCSTTVPRPGSARDRCCFTGRPGRSLLQHRTLLLLGAGARTVSPAVPVGLRCSPAAAHLTRSPTAMVSPAVPVGLRCSAPISHTRNKAPVALHRPSRSVSVAGGRAGRAGHGRPAGFTGRPGRSPLQVTIDLVAAGVPARFHRPSRSVSVAGRPDHQPGRCRGRGFTGRPGRSPLQARGIRRA